MAQTDSPPRFLIAGIDTLHLTYDVDPRSGEIDFDELDYLKARIKDDPDATCVSVEMGGLTLKLLPRGAFPYTYVFQQEDFTMKLARHMSPAILVEFRSKALWSKGYLDLHETILRYIEACGYLVRKGVTVSRVDAAFDYHLPVRDFDEDNVISKCRKNKIYRTGTDRETIHIGGGDSHTQFRIYHKSKEIAQASGKTWFHDIWGVTDDVWRIETQLRRDALKTAAIDDIGDLGEKFSDHLVELFTDHTSLRLKEASNVSRRPLHPLWADLHLQAANWPRLPRAEAKIDRRVSLLERRQQTVTSIIGYLSRLGAFDALLDPDRTIPSFDDVLGTLRLEANDNLHPAEFKQKLQGKMDEIEVAS